MLGETFGRDSFGARLHAYRKNFLRTDANEVEEGNLEEVRDCTGDECSKLDLLRFITEKK